MLTAPGKTEAEQPHAAKIQPKNRPQVKGESRQRRTKNDKGAPHGMCSTHKEQVDADLLAFIKAQS